MTNQVETSNPAVRILKEASCPTASGKGTLTYHVGCNASSAINASNAIQFRVVQNTGGGYFSAEWVAWELIQPALESAALPLTSFPLIKLYQGKSTNTPAFLMAVLKQEGLVRNLEGNVRGYELLDSLPFLTAMKDLIASNVNLTVANPADVVVMKAKKPAPVKTMPETGIAVQAV
jgi:hypothetical protein